MDDTTSMTHVETVVLLSRQKPDDTIEIDLDLDELDATGAETKATYQEIKDYVLFMCYSSLKSAMSLDHRKIFQGSFDSIFFLFWTLWHFWIFCLWQIIVLSYFNSTFPFDLIYKTGNDTISVICKKAEKI